MCCTVLDNNYRHVFLCSPSFDHSGGIVFERIIEIHDFVSQTVPLFSLIRRRIRMKLRALFQRSNTDTVQND